MKHTGPKKLLFVAALAFSASTAQAQSGDSAVAQALFDQAKQLLVDGHAAEACPKLEESQRLEPRSGTLINLASCYEQLGHLASAWSKYVEAATSAKASGNAARETVARQRAATLVPRLSKLAITLDPALKSVKGLELTRDGRVVREPEWGVALPSDPGEHEVTAKAPGYEPFQTKLNVTGQGQTMTVSVPMLVAQAVTEAKPASSSRVEEAGPAPSPGHSAQHTAALVVGGVGLVGLGLGTAFGLSSKSKHDQAARSCNELACDGPGVSYGNAALRDGNLSTALMIAGGVGLAAGVTLWLTAPKANDSASAHVGLGFGSLHVKATF
ncbi:MAG: hypothetical protein ABI488_04745 [Polyangiaceae bacterium]